MASVSVVSHVKTLALASPLALSAALFLVVALTVRYVLNLPKRLNLPVVGTGNPQDLSKDLVEGTIKYPNTPYIIPISPPQVILPVCVLDEVRNLPETQVSFMKSVRDIFLYKHTGIGEDRPEIITAVKVDLTRHIASVLDGLQDEIQYSMNKELGACEDWTSIVLYQKLVRIVALLSGRVFVGLPLSRDEEWLDSTIKFTIDAVAAADAIRKWNILLRPFVAPFLPEIRRVKQHKARGGELLAPLLQEKLHASQNEKASSSKSGDQRGAFVSWVLRHTDEHERYDPRVLGVNQMVLSFAAIHTTTMATTHAIFDLVSRPEYLGPLRDEINQVLEEDGYDLNGDGSMKLKKSSIPKLRKLDSFLKESQRLSPPGLLSNTRITTAPLSLSTGHTLPKGTRFGFPSWAIHTSTTAETFSPAYNPSTAKGPTEFDGFRFSNLRAMGNGKENKHQFVTTAPESLNFGYGNHACPGRFFASNEIKVLMIEVLKNWDIRLKGDVEGKGGEDKRPENYYNEATVAPNPLAEIEIRRRKENDL
ncbi:uncharacterized protein BP5553_07488 [Venustampulla echinocandica]|uniref:Cytochrome P450 n=1 Tax=Venustampulla echinocandica TaxID=2656787 RepID=A0A370TGP7_9HELO|nr:uncharacterized protein BP5553_07488 [Venustampulla echinocandica]RDL34360.1 hypothetical protein BP5553_07488 [Venustampulla echinocandica]